MANTQGWQPDTQATVIDGMNRSREAELIGPAQAHLLRNISTRGGRARPRPRWVKRATLAAGFLQGASGFRAADTLLAAVGGKVFEIDPKDWSVTELSGWLSSDEALLSTEAQAALVDERRNSPHQPRMWFCETVGSIIIQDDQSRPFLYDGATFRRATEDEVPVGSVMAYGNGRLAVAVAGGRAVRIGDIRQSQIHQSELKFEETTFLTGGGDFSFPTKVKSLSVVPIIDTGSGQGSLIVGCEDQVHALKTQITSRASWAETEFATVVLPTRGIVGGNAAVAVNQDIYFRSRDGLRSVRTSTSDYGAPGLAPLSSEVRHRFEKDTEFLLEDASLVYFDNRLLASHSPFVYGRRALSQGVIALNFDALSSRGQKSPPVFDGEWDGLLIANLFTAVVGGRERCFALGRSAAETAVTPAVPPEGGYESFIPDGKKWSKRTVSGSIAWAGYQVLSNCTYNYPGSGRFSPGSPTIADCPFNTFSSDIKVEILEQDFTTTPPRTKYRATLLASTMWDPPSAETHTRLHAFGAIFGSGVVAGNVYSYGSTGAVEFWANNGDVFVVAAEWNYIYWHGHPYTFESGNIEITDTWDMVFEKTGTGAEVLLADASARDLPWGDSTAIPVGAADPVAGTPEQYYASGSSTYGLHPALVDVVDTPTTRTITGKGCVPGLWPHGALSMSAVGTITITLSDELAGGSESDSGNGIWELLPESAEPGDEEVTQVLESGVKFGDSPGTLKSIRRCDMLFSDIRGDLDVRVYFKPAQYPLWVLWDTFSFPERNDQRPWGKVMPRRSPVIQTRSVPDVKDENTGRPLSVAPGFQVRIEWDGQARLDYWQLFQERVGNIPAFADNAPLPANPDDTTVPAGQKADEFWNSHSASPLAGTE